MTHYNTSYEVSTDPKIRQEQDEKAIADIMEYLGTAKAALFGDLVAVAVCIAQVPDTKFKINSLNMMMGMAGISGRPFHAFCRRYCLKAYREWMSEGSDGVETDEMGFIVQKEEA